MINDQGKPAIPVYVLTDEGYAVSQILPDQEHGAFERYLDALHALVPDIPISIFHEENGVCQPAELEQVSEGKGSQA